MNCLIVGGDGLIGQSVAQHLTGNEIELERIVSTTRRKTSVQCAGLAFLDLLQPQDFGIDNIGFHLAFLCAGINGFAQCETDQTSWRVNVDGVLNVALRLIKCGTFVVYPSTQAVEWSDSSYGRQRAQVEAVLLAVGNAAIIRIGRVHQGNRMACAKQLVETGMLFQPGVYYWDDRPKEQALWPLTR